MNGVTGKVKKSHSAPRFKVRAKSQNYSQKQSQNHKFEIETPTLPKTGEEWGTQEAWKREAKAKSKTNHLRLTSGAPAGICNNLGAIGTGGLDGGDGDYVDDVGGGAAAG